MEENRSAIRKAIGDDYRRILEADTQLAAMLRGEISWVDYMDQHPELEEVVQASREVTPRSYVSSVASSEGTPDVPANAPADSRMVWHPVLRKYVLGRKEFDYEPNIRYWLNKQRRESRSRRSPARRSASRNRSRRRSPSRRRRSSSRNSFGRTRNYRRGRGHSPSR